MIVDDASFVRIRIKRILKDRMSQVWEVENGAAAVNLYRLLKDKNYLPDLIFMDISMDLMNGVEASRRILEINPDAKIIVVSAEGTENRIRECIALGVSDFICKPFSDEKLTSSFQNALG